MAQRSHLHRRKRPVPAGLAVTRIFLLALVGICGCATKGNLEDLGVEMRRIAARQDSILIRQGILISDIREEIALSRDTTRGLSDDLFSFRGDIAATLREMSGRLAQIESLIGENQRGISAVRGQLSELEAAWASPQMVTQTEEGSTEGNSGVSVTDPEELYAQAIQLMREGFLGTAQAIFEEFLREYPDHTLVPDAMFYRADIIEQSGNAETALEAFRELRSSFNDFTRRLDVWYRIALLRLRSGDRYGAIVTLEEIVQEDPGSEIARVAAEKLEEIRLPRTSTPPP